MSTHIEIIKRAKKRGLYVITCDYVPENEGHKYADEAHYYSTTDFDSVLSLAREKNIDAILTFCSDPAAQTVAYVAEKLDLPGSGFQAVKIMSEKDLFRDFLKKHDFNTPKYKSYSDLETLKADLDSFEYPVLLKPVDSSASKGCVKINKKEKIKNYYNNALSFSRCKRVIVEEYIEPLGCQIHGDAFVYDGEIKFITLLDHYFNDLTPCASAYPSRHSEVNIERVKNELQRFISAVGFRQGGVNVEARISQKDNEVYLIEVGPRNGGNLMPQLIRYAMGYDFLDAVLNSILGLEYSEQLTASNGIFSNLIVNTNQVGILKDIMIDDDLKKKIVYSNLYRKKGDSLSSSNMVVTGIAGFIAQYDSLREMEKYVSNFSKYYKIELV